MEEQQKMPTIDIGQYGGRQVAILDGDIVASGETLKEVLEEAQRQCPDRLKQEFKVLSVPRGLNVIYSFCV